MFINRPGKGQAVSNPELVKFSKSRLIRFVCVHRYTGSKQSVTLVFQLSQRCRGIDSGAAAAVGTTRRNSCKFKQDNKLAALCELLISNLEVKHMLCCKQSKTNKRMSCMTRGLTLVSVDKRDRVDLSPVTKHTRLLANFGANVVAATSNG